MAVILRYFTKFHSFGANYVRMVKYVCRGYVALASPQNSFLQMCIYSKLAILAEVIENECINERYTCATSTYIHFCAHQCYPPHDRSELSADVRKQTSYSTTSVLISAQSIILLEKPYNHPSCSLPTVYGVGRFHFKGQLQRKFFYFNKRIVVVSNHNICNKVLSKIT